MLATTTNAFHTAIAWAGFIFIALIVVDMATNLRLKIAALFTRPASPNIDVAVQALMVDELNLNAPKPNADPTAPDERVAAVNEYAQYRRRRG
jgi:hypothetical protein